MVATSDGPATAKAQRLDLLEVLVKLCAQGRAAGRGGPEARGFVSLVGAGPGDPELLTVKAVRRRADIDLVLHDGLVTAATVALTRGAQHLPLGATPRAKCQP